MSTGDERTTGHDKASLPGPEIVGSAGSPPVPRPSAQDYVRRRLGEQTR